MEACSAPKLSLPGEPASKYGTPELPAVGGERVLNSPWIGGDTAPAYGAGGEIPAWGETEEAREWPAERV
jgi:hypothetical protein